MGALRLVPRAKVYIPHGDAGTPDQVWNDVGTVTAVDTFGLTYDTGYASYFISWSQVAGRIEIVSNPDETETTEMSKEGIP